jgi:hypothetical protein
MPITLRSLSILFALFLGACTASVTYPNIQSYKVPQEQRTPPQERPTTPVTGGSSDFYRTQTLESIIAQNKAIGRQHKELDALNKYWTAKFQAKPSNWQSTTCADIEGQDKNSAELKGVVVETKAKYAEANKNTPMINRNSVEPRLVQLEQLSANYEVWIKQARATKSGQAERSVTDLAQFTSEYYLHLDPLSSNPLAGAVAVARVTISTSACTEEQLATLTKQIDEYEAKGKSAFAYETECRASTKCMRDRAMSEAMTSLVPNLCDEIQNLKFLRSELVRLRSNPSGVVSLYELNKTGEMIQGVQSDMAEQKAEFAKTTGQQFSPALCAKVPQ